MTRILEFISIVLVALTLIPSGAHFFELPNKISLVPENYFVVRNIYRGWREWLFFVSPLHSPCSSFGFISPMSRPQTGLLSPRTGPLCAATGSLGMPPALC